VNPYRDRPQQPADKLELWPDAGRGALTIIGAFSIVAIAVMLVGASTVVDVQCRRTGDSVSCTTSDSTFATSSRQEHSTTGLKNFVVVATGSGKNSRQHLAMVGTQGEVSLSESSLPSSGRDAAVARLNDFARNAGQPSVQVALGSPWDGLQILPLFGFVLAVLYLIMGSRVTAVVDRRHGHVRVDSRLWPLPRRGIDFECEQLKRFHFDCTGKGNTRIVVELTDGTRFPLTQSYTSSDKTPALQQLEEFVRRLD